MKRVILFAAIGGLSLLPLAVGAEELGSSAAPTTHPSHPFDHRQAARVRDGLGKAFDEPLTAQDKADIDKFMTTYSPKRWDRMQDLPEKRKENIEKLIRGKIRQLQRLKEEDPEIYQIEIDRLPIEDAMFDLGWQIKHQDPKEPKNGPLHQQLRATVKQFVDSSIKERRLRLASQQESLQKMQARVQQESNEINKISEKRDQFIENAAASIENGGGEIFRGMSLPGWRHPQRESTGPATEPSADSGGAESSQ